MYITQDLFPMLCQSLAESDYQDDKPYPLIFSYLLFLIAQVELPNPWPDHIDLNEALHE